MDIFEKVEKLVEKAGVSYEDAKAALDKAEGDLLDAMILLEKEGKAKAPEQSSYSTKYDQQAQYVSVEETVENDRKSYTKEELLDTVRFVLAQEKAVEFQKFTETEAEE